MITNYSSQNQLVGFTECVRMNKITSMKQDRLSIKLKRFKLNEADESNDDERKSDIDETIEDKGLLKQNCDQRNFLT